MEFPELLSVLLYEDCSTHVSQELPRLQALANANGSNTALQRYLSYFEEFKQTPTADQLRAFCGDRQYGVEAIKADLEFAENWHNVEPPSGFALAFRNSWKAADKQHRLMAHKVAHNIAAGSSLDKKTKYELTKLYGEDETQWDYVAYSDLWYAKAMAANTFARLEEEVIDPANEHEFKLGEGAGVTQDGEVVHTTLMGVRLSNIVTKPQTWLWPDRIPSGTTTLFAGKPGIGKSTVLLDITSRITTGADWPDGEKNILPPSEVLLCLSEDSVARTVAPRLKIAGADLSKVIWHNRAKCEDGDRTLQLDADLAALRRTLEANPDIKLIILDPLESFSGDASININKEIRPILVRLVQLCEATNIAVIGIVHDNKRTDVSAIQKIPGGSAVSGVIRSAWGFSRDPENPNLRYMSFIKGSLSKKTSGLEFMIDEKEVDGDKASYIVWGKENDSTADDLINAERAATSPTGGNKQIDLARDFLLKALKAGPRKQADLISEMEAVGIRSVHTLYRAKDQLKIIDLKKGELFTERGHRSWWILDKEEPVMDDSVI